ncbi:hypothetical protein LCGC14_1986440 [marine sediment metagenome]|uniref:Uncharacterized protein n=1 Tax=marine sediment metagenome TaxID=412755 RepID=A0A0F9F7P5_9ZZZZ
MGYNSCRKCGFGSRSPGTGRMPDPQRKWWQLWKTVPCDACGGDGFAKPPGWPDRAEIDRLRPDPPPPPPPPPGGYRPSAALIDVSNIELPTWVSAIDRPGDD